MCCMQHNCKCDCGLNFVSESRQRTKRAASLAVVFRLLCWGLWASSWQLRLQNTFVDDGNPALFVKSNIWSCRGLGHGRGPWLGCEVVKPMSCCCAVCSQWLVIVRLCIALQSFCCGSACYWSCANRAILSRVLTGCSSKNNTFLNILSNVGSVLPVFKAGIFFCIMMLKLKISSVGNCVAFLVISCRSLSYR